jgi:transcription antitermination factor NusG
VCGCSSKAILKGITSLTEDGEALPFLTNPILSAPAPGALPEPVAATLPQQWMAAYTSPRHEKAVVRQLDVREVESFLPLYRSIRRWKNGCRVAIDQPLFPNYVFVHVRRCDSVKVLQVPGVLWIVSAGREPSVLPHVEMEALRSGLPGRHFEPHAYLAVGEKVRVVSGAFEGMVGVLVRKKNECRVVLTVDLIRQSVSVEIGIDEVEPLPQ